MALHKKYQIHAGVTALPLKSSIRAVYENNNDENS